MTRKQGPETTHSSPASADAGTDIQRLVTFQEPPKDRELSVRLDAITADPHAQTDLKRFAGAFLLWEGGFRHNPSEFLSADEVAALESSDLAAQRAVYFILCMRQVDSLALQVPA